MMKKYTFAVVGALGNVGTKMRNILETSDLPIGNLLLMDLVQSVAKKVHWRDNEYAVVEAKAEAFAGVDVVIMSAGGCGITGTFSRSGENGLRRDRQFYRFQDGAGASLGNSRSQCGRSGKSSGNHRQSKLLDNSNAGRIKTNS